MKGPVAETGLEGRLVGAQVGFITTTTAVVFGPPGLRRDAMALTKGIGDGDDGVGGELLFGFIVVIDGDDGGFLLQLERF